MAPNVSVPMNFGKHLLDSPTHSTLELRANNGATVRASSVILSFNSPVIDHMTTTLHLTSVDMEEFSEEAVRYFVDAAYTGETPPISRDMFRDINKMGHVFEMTWLVTRFAELFASIAEAVQEPFYQDFVFLFDEAAFVLTKLKSRQFIEIALTKIRSLNGQQDFISRYLENLTSLSRQQLDLIMELAGPDVEYVVEPLTEQLTASLSRGETVLSDNCKYLLENCDLYSCQQHNAIICEQLFDVLEQVCLSQENFKWVFQLHRKVIKKPVQTVVFQQPTSSATAVLCSDEIAVQVTTTGSAEQCGHAKEEKQHIIGEGSSKESDWGCDFGEHVIEIYIPESKCEKITSKIAEIQEKTNTWVDLNECSMCLVTISGDEENCTEAKVMVQEIVEPERGSMDIWVETSSLSRIIGKKRARLRQIERLHHVKIDVTDIKEENETKVILIGTKEDVLNTREYIYDIVDEIIL